MDVFTTRMAIGLLGFTCILGLSGSIWLTAIGVETPQILVAVISGCSGSLCTFLVPGKREPDHRPDFSQNPPLP